jgi:hypothetical protein
MLNMHEFSAGFEVLSRIPNTEDRTKWTGETDIRHTGKPKQRHFNAAFSRYGKGYWAIPRVNPLEIPPNEVDVTRRFAVMQVSDKGRSRTIRMLPVSELMQNSDDVSLEDLRMLRTGGRTFDFSGTVVIRGVPRVGVFKGREPFTGVSFSEVTIPGHFADGKNGSPANSDGTVVYRPEDDGKSLVFQDADNRLDHGRRIKIPDVWWTHDGRFGLTGIFRIPVPDEKFNLFDTIIHGYRKPDKDTYYYAFGWARCRARADGTFNVVGVAHDPLMDFDSLSAVAGVWDPPSKEFGKFVVYSDGFDTDGRNLLGVPTLGDKTMFMTRITERPKRSTYIQ